jgi:hypothetical protein
VIQKNFFRKICGCLDDLQQSLNPIEPDTLSDTLFPLAQLVLPTAGLPFLRAMIERLVIISAPAARPGVQSSRIGEFRLRRRPGFP